VDRARRHRRGRIRPGPLGRPRGAFRGEPGRGSRADAVRHRRPGREHLGRRPHPPRLAAHRRVRHRRRPQRDHDVYDPGDAIPSAAHFLTANSPPASIQAALFAYNHSDRYVSDVLDWAARYAAGGTQVLTAEQSPVCEQAGLGPLPAGTAGKVIAYAGAQLGKPYLWGATGPDAYDCSGLAMMAYRAAGITIPRTSQAQWAYGRQIPGGQARPGDLVFFAGADGTPAAAGHVGIVVSPATHTMIDAYATGYNVEYDTYGLPVSKGGLSPVVGFTRP